MVHVFRINEAKIKVDEHRNQKLTLNETVFSKNF